MKKLLVLAAGILQVPVIMKAREMGLYVIAADGDMNAVGLRYADKAIIADITSEDEMLNIAESEKIDGVIHPCSEISMSVMGKINDELNLAGVTKEQAIRATDKHLMREAFEKYGAPSPVSILTTSMEHAWNCLQTQFNSEAIIKPSRNSGSRGITRVNKDMQKKEFGIAYQRAMKESRDKSVLIEQFISGSEFSVEIIVWSNQINVLQVTDKKTTGTPYFVELGHSQPSIFPKDITDKIKQAAIEGVKALGVDNCACHAEVKFENDKAYIIEIGARLGGDFISTELTPLSTGIDMVGAAINCALGIPPNLTSMKRTNSVCIRYLCPKPGILVNVKNQSVLNDERVHSWQIYRRIGDFVPEITSSLSRSGHVIVTAETPSKAIEYADYIIETVKLETR